MEITKAIPGDYELIKDGAHIKVWSVPRRDNGRKYHVWEVIDITNETDNGAFDPFGDTLPRGWRLLGTYDEKADAFASIGIEPIEWRG